MKLMNTSILKKISLPFVKMTIVNPQNVKNENNNIDGNITEKLCPMCKEWRDINSYYKNNYSIDGYNSTCKICCKYRLKERYDFYKNNAKRRNNPIEYLRIV